LVSAWESTVDFNVGILNFLFVKERIETKETVINTESKNVSWNDPLGSSADHDVANKRYPINIQLNSYKNLGLCDTSAIALHILWYQTSSP